MLAARVVHAGVAAAEPGSGGLLQARACPRVQDGHLPGVARSTMGLHGASAGVLPFVTCLVLTPCFWAMLMTPSPNPSRDPGPNWC